MNRIIFSKESNKKKKRNTNNNLSLLIFQIIKIYLFSILTINSNWTTFLSNFKIRIILKIESF